MKKFFFSTCSAVIICVMSYAQSPLWVVGNQYFDGPAPLALPIPPNQSITVEFDNTTAQALFTSNAIHNPVTGALLFFIKDGSIYDDNGNGINYLIGEGPYDLMAGNSEIAIIPDPGNCKRYYVIGDVLNKSFWYYNDFETITPKLHYGIIDLEMPRANTFANSNIPLYGDLVTLGNGAKLAPCINMVPAQYHEAFQGSGAAQIAITPKNTNGEHFIFYQSANQYIFVFKLDASGISYVANSVFSVKDGIVPPVYSTTSSQATRSELEVVVLANGDMRVVGKTLDLDNSFPINLSNGADRLYKVDFNSNGLPIQNTYAFFSFETNASSGDLKPKIKGIEISPNKSYVYITKTMDSQFSNPIMCFDINTLQPVATGINMSAALNFQYSMIETNSQGEIMLAQPSGLYALLNPNNPGTSTINSNFLPVQGGIALANMYRSSNIPNWENKYGLYLLPDQMDFDPNCQIGCYSYTCGEGSAAEACCQFYSNTNVAISGDIIISSNTTWSPGLANNPFQSANGQVNLDANIFVNPGVTLTIDNMTLKMSPDSKITVLRGATTNQAGGTLVVVNSTLTKSNVCGACSMWPGIEVQGHPTVASTSNSHGTASFNNSTVEYAYFGAMAGTFIAPNSLSFNNNRSGGRIVSANSTFRNNKFDVFFMSYNFPNASQFLFTNFISDNDLMKNLTGDIIHAYLYNVQNVRFFSCNFENSTAFKPDGESRGIGIGSVNSHFIVDKYFIGNIDPTFNKLDIGVRTTATSSGLNYVVQKAIFNNNYNGIVSEGELNAHILKNTFNIYKAGPGNAITETYGVVMSSCNRYRIEENFFQDASPNLNINAFNYGCRIASSGPFANVVEKNEFRNLRSAGISSGINAQDYSQISTKKAVGLQWLCNDFYNNKTHDLWVSSGRISPFQGTCFSGTFIGSSQPAGNVFNTSNNPQWHVRLENGVLPITYYHRTYDYNTEPTLISAGVTPVSCFMPSNAVVCGRQTQVPGLTTGDARDSLNSYFDEKMMFESTMDYGSREELLLDVLGEFLSPEQKRDLLLGTNTTISDEVLIKYLQTAPSNTLLFQVMLANSPLSDKVMYYVMEESTLPSGMKQQLLNAQNGISIYDASMQYLQNIELEIMNIENELIYRYLSDTTNTYSILDVIDLIESYPSHTESSMESLFGAYVRVGLYDKADSLNTILKANYEEPDYGILTDLVLASIQTDYYTMIATDSTLLEQLEEWSSWSDQRFGPFARTLLTNYYGYFFPVAFDEGGGTRNMAYPNYKLQDFEPEITIFPNPTTDHFFIVFNENADVSPQREARVYNLAGNLQFTRSFDDNAYVLEINTENMAQGMYIVVISANGVDVGTYKVAVK